MMSMKFARSVLSWSDRQEQDLLDGTVHAAKKSSPAANFLQRSPTWRLVALTYVVSNDSILSRF
jgi:hypothetical protein